MCGRLSLSASQEDLEEEFNLAFSDYRPRYNVAPTQFVWAIAAAADRTPQAVQLRWGFIPRWATDPGIGNRMINARAETIAEKPAFKAAFAKRRCLILADGFYEWQKVGNRKVPMRIRLASGAPFALAGIWEQSVLANGDAVRSCAILTTAASDSVRPIHDRMPLILAREERARWLDPAAASEVYGELLRPYPGHDLEAYAVSTLVNSPANDRVEVTEPA